MRSTSLDIARFVDWEDGLPHPRWEDIFHQIVDRRSPSDPSPAFTAAADQWLELLADALPGVYYLGASQHFLVMAPDKGPDGPQLLFAAERCRTAILRILAGVGDFRLPGKLPVLVFANSRSYYQYLAPHYPEGEFGSSAGVQIRNRYPHVAMIDAEFRLLEKTLAHELTHVALAHAKLPLWIEEGLAQLIDRICCGEPPLQLTTDRARRHRKFWRNHGLEQFWNGDGFHKASPAQSFSYELAEVLLTLLIADHQPTWFGLSRSRQKQLIDFLNHANIEDGGNAAAESYLNQTLTQIAAKFLGSQQDA